MPYFQLKVRNVHPKKLDRCTEKKQGGKGTAAGRAFEKGHLSSFDRSNDQQKKTTGLSMPQTRKMNSKKKETMHSTKRWLFATLLHSYHSSLPTYVSCTFMQARDIKFLPNFFPDPITDLRFPPRWKSKPPNQIKNKKKTVRQDLAGNACTHRHTHHAIRFSCLCSFSFSCSPPLSPAQREQVKRRKRSNRKIASGNSQEVVC